MHPSTEPSRSKSAPGQSARAVGPRPAASRPPTRAGFVVLAGLPNAGKSTLLNALVGRPLGIVAAKAQSTWQRVTGIRTERDVQMVFVDTPGFVDGPSLFHRSMATETEAARHDADAAVVVVDGARSTSAGEWRRLAGFLRGIGCPAAAAVNKSDQGAFAARRAKGAARRLGLPAFAVSAREGAGLEPLLAFLRVQLPTSPFLYPKDDLATAPVRFFVQEIVREAVFGLYRQEVPYSVAVRVEELQESEDPVYVAAVVYVERNSQKGIVVGKGGAGIKALGRDARRKIEDFLGARVYLDLWVKVSDGWRRKRETLMAFGYAVPDEGE